MECFWTILPPVWSEYACSLIIFFWNTLSPIHRFNHLFLPPAELNTICFPSQSPLYCPKVSQLFKECWEELMSFLSRISQTQLMFFFVRQSFLFWNQISYFKGHVYSSLIVEMKSERYQFWKRCFKNQAFWSKTQHTSFNCLVFWKQKLTRCKIKMASFFFHGSLYPL
jgi:hypothetical protein